MGKAGVKKVLAFASLLAWAGSAAAQPYPPPPPSSPPPSSPPAYSPRPASDQCGARDLQYLVGRPTTEIPIPVEPGRRRVICTTCPITPEYFSFRQTILFDAATGRVTSVTCS